MPEVVQGEGQKACRRGSTVSASGSGRASGQVWSACQVTRGESGGAGGRQRLPLPFLRSSSAFCTALAGAVASPPPCRPLQPTLSHFFTGGPATGREAWGCGGRAREVAAGWLSQLPAAAASGLSEEAGRDTEGPLQVGRATRVSPCFLNAHVYVETTEEP